MDCASKLWELGSSFMVWACWTAGVCWVFCLYSHSQRNLSSVFILKMVFFMSMCLSLKPSLTWASEGKPWTAHGQISIKTCLATGLLVHSFHHSSFFFGPPGGPNPAGTAYLLWPVVHAVSQGFLGVPWSLFEGCLNLSVLWCLCPRFFVYLYWPPS